HTRSLRDWSSDVCSSDLVRRHHLLFGPVQECEDRGGTSLLHCSAKRHDCAHAYDTRWLWLHCTSRESCLLERSRCWSQGCYSRRSEERRVGKECRSGWWR